ncbi:MAG TPA: hypothetical protein VGN34_34705, partial [Ktedonobacteraceae bacterium]
LALQHGHGFSRSLFLSCLTHCAIFFRISSKTCSGTKNLHVVSIYVYGAFSQKGQQNAGFLPTRLSNGFVEGKNNRTKAPTIAHRMKNKRPDLRKYTYSSYHTF